MPVFDDGEREGKLEGKVEEKISVGSIGYDNYPLGRQKINADMFYNKPWFWIIMLIMVTWSLSILKG